MPRAANSNNAAVNKKRLIKGAPTAAWRSYSDEAGCFLD